MRQTQDLLFSTFVGSNPTTPITFSLITGTNAYTLFYLKSTKRIYAWSANIMHIFRTLGMINSDLLSNNKQMTEIVSGNKSEEKTHE
jgi:hypothetical protein